MNIRRLIIVNRVFVGIRAGRTIWTLMGPSASAPFHLRNSDVSDNTRGAEGNSDHMSPAARTNRGLDIPVILILDNGYGRRPLCQRARKAYAENKKQSFHDYPPSKRQYHEPGKIASRSLLAGSVAGPSMPSYALPVPICGATQPWSSESTTG